VGHRSPRENHSQYYDDTEYRVKYGHENHCPGWYTENMARRRTSHILIIYNGTQ